MLPMRNGLSAMPQSVRVEDEGAVYHAVVWLDHDEAQVIYFSADVYDPQSARPEQWSRHIHAGAGRPSGSAASAEPDFYLEVAKACEEAPAVFLAGLSTAKTEFVKYLHRHMPESIDRICGIETMARMTDSQLVAEARRFFARTDHSRLSSP
jgi:hypothetical protein